MTREVDSIPTIKLTSRRPKNYLISLPIIIITVLFLYIIMGTIGTVVQPTHYMTLRIAWAVMITLFALPSQEKLITCREGNPLVPSVALLDGSRVTATAAGDWWWHRAKFEFLILRLNNVHYAEMSEGEMKSKFWSGAESYTLTYENENGYSKREAIDIYTFTTLFSKFVQTVERRHYNIQPYCTQITKCQQDTLSLWSTRKSPRYADRHVV